MEEKQGEHSLFLTNHVQPIVSAHLTSAHAVEQLSATVNKYATLHSRCTKAKDSLERFTAKCKRDDGRIILPPSCGIRWDKLRWPALVDDASFSCKEEQDAITKLSQETNQKVYEALLSAKQKYIKHLDSILNLDTFVKLRTEEYSTALIQHLKTTLSMMHLASPTDEQTVGMRKEAASKYQQSLTDQLKKLTADLAQSKLKHDAEAAAAKALDARAIDEITNGASTGATIAAVAAKAANTATAPLTSKLSKLQKQQHDVNQLLKSTRAQMHQQQLQAASSSLSAPSNSRRHRNKRERSPANRGQQGEDDDDENDVEEVYIDTSRPGKAVYTKPPHNQQKHHRTQLPDPFGQGGQQQGMQHFNQPMAAVPSYSLYLPQQRNQQFQPARRK